jgi:hypothetical protein
MTATTGKARSAPNIAVPRMGCRPARPKVSCLFFKIQMPNNEACGQARERYAFLVATEGSLRSILGLDLHAHGVHAGMIVWQGRRPGTGGFAVLVHRRLH